MHTENDFHLNQSKTEYATKIYRVRHNNMQYEFKMTSTKSQFPQIFDNVCTWYCFIIKQFTLYNNNKEKHTDGVLLSVLSSLVKLVWFVWSK